MSADQKHTPGPWLVSTDSGGVMVGPKVIDVVRRRLVAAVSYDGAPFGDQSEAEANARLIAAAPALLEALLYIRPLIEHVGGRSMGDYAAGLVAIDRALSAVGAVVCAHQNWRPVTDGRKCMDCGEVLE